MADFKLFYPTLEKNEGGYANEKNDTGGETWKGISRNNYPGWVGWKYIDEVKSLPNYPKDGIYKVICAFMNEHLRPIKELEEKVVFFYKSSQWDPNKCDQIRNQSIAEYITDWGINAGLSTPIKHLQKLLKLTDDGKVGPMTLSAINDSDQKHLFDLLKQDRILFYKHLVEIKPHLEEFLDGWLDRANAFNFKQ